MDEEVAVREALFTYVTTNEPAARPMGAIVLAEGRRSRRRRNSARLAIGVVVGVLAVTGTVEVLGRLSASDQIGSASLQEAICRSVAPGGSDAALKQARIGCHLASVLPEMLPNVIFYRLYGKGHTAPFEPYPSEQIVGGYDANAVVTDSRGTGSVTFVISELQDPADIPTTASCASKGHCALRTGPHDETIAVYTSSGGPGADKGRVGITVYVYSGQTVILAGSSNADERHLVDGVSVASRPEPPLTTEQLIEIATAPELIIFP